MRCTLNAGTGKGDSAWADVPVLGLDLAARLLSAGPGAVAWTPLVVLVFAAAEVSSVQGERHFSFLLFLFFNFSRFPLFIF